MDYLVRRLAPWSPPLSPARLLCCAICYIVIAHLSRALLLFVLGCCVCRAIVWLKRVVRLIASPTLRPQPLSRVPLRCCCRVASFALYLCVSICSFPAQFVTVTEPEWHPTVTDLLDTLFLNYHHEGKDYQPDGTPLA